LAAIVFLCVASIALNKSPIFDVDIKKFRLNAANSDSNFELGLSDTGRLILVQGDSVEGTLVLIEKVVDKLDILREEKSIGSYEAPSTYLPSKEQQRTNQKALPDKPMLLERLQQAVRSTPFKADMFSAFVRDVERAKTQQPIGIDAFINTPLAVKVRHRLFKEEHHWLGIVSLSGVADEAAVIRMVAGFDHKARYINVSTQSTSIIQSYQKEMVMLCLLGLLLIAVILMIKLGRYNALKTMLPIVAALLFTVTLLLLLNHPLTLFHIASLLLVLGLSLDYSLFTQRIKNGGSDAVSMALVMCCISTIIMFGLLATSSILVLNAIGLTVFMGASSGFVFSLMARKDVV